MIKLALTLVLAMAAADTPATKRSSARLPAPDAQVQREKMKLVEEIDAHDFVAAKDVTSRRELALRLLQAAKETHDDKAARFAMLMKASSTAAEVPDALLALSVIDELAVEFDVDDLAMRAEVIVVASGRTESRDEHWEMVPLIMPLLDQAILNERFDLARRLANLAVTETRRAGNTTAISRQLLRVREVQDVEAASHAIEPALEILVKSPDDPSANSAVGRFLCLMKGDWQHGLPHLAKGDDQRLKAAAERELKGAVGAQERLAIADGWWDLGESADPTPRQKLRLHAARWYRKALDGLSGVSRAKAEKRLADLEGLRRQDG